MEYFQISLLPRFVCTHLVENGWKGCLKANLHAIDMLDLLFLYKNSKDYNFHVTDIFGDKGEHFFNYKKLWRSRYTLEDIVIFFLIIWLCIFCRPFAIWSQFIRTRELMKSTPWLRGGKLQELRASSLRPQAKPRVFWFLRSSQLKYALVSITHQNIWNE